LLEHVEGKGGQIFLESFAWGGLNGPIVKAARKDNQTSIFQDAGLYANAKEIKVNLETLLRKSLGEPVASDERVK
jgi:hypothetical protein